MSDWQNKNISKHILPTSSNLLGICFVILNFTSLWKVGRIERIVIDKMVGVSMFLFLIASVLSYISMRSRTKSDWYEKIADMVFLFGLTSMTLIAVTITFEIV